MYAYDLPMYLYNINKCNVQQKCTSYILIYANVTVSSQISTYK